MQGQPEPGSLWALTEQASLPGSEHTSQQSKLASALRALKLGPLPPAQAATSTFTSLPLSSFPLCFSSNLPAFVPCPTPTLHLHPLLVFLKSLVSGPRCAF